VPPSINYTDDYSPHKAGSKSAHVCSALDLQVSTTPDPNPNPNPNPIPRPQDHK